MPSRVSYEKYIKEERRQIRAMINNYKLPLPENERKTSKRASVSTSAKGSITVEAAMAVPIFFLAVVCLLYLIEMMAVQTAVRSGLQYAGKKMAQECAIAPFMTVSGLEKDVVEGIGAARLERSIVEGGSAGIDCSRSQISSRTGIANLQATYKICVPIPLFHIKPVNCSVNMKVKAWTGYEKEGFGDTDEDTVYIAETGIVYHRDYHCAYLDLTIMSVSNAQLETMRNSSGGKYHACEHCHPQNTGSVFITKYGNRYHSSILCSGLKRTVYAVPLSEAAGKGACSKCGK